MNKFKMVLFFFMTLMSSQAIGSSIKNTTHLILTTVPAHSKVYLGTSFVGYTPLDQVIHSGTYWLNISKKGYIDHVGVIKLKSGVAVRLSYDLQKAFVYRPYVP